MGRRSLLRLEAAPVLLLKFYIITLNSADWLMMTMVSSVKYGALLGAASVADLSVFTVGLMLLCALLRTHRAEEMVLPRGIAGTFPGFVDRCTAAPLHFATRKQIKTLSAERLLAACGGVICSICHFPYLINWATPLKDRKGICVTKHSTTLKLDSPASHLDFSA